MNTPTTPPARPIDCHAHVIDPARFRFADGPGYRPAAHEVGTVHEYIAVLDAAGIGHGLLVQPGAYGYDNRAMVDALLLHHGRLKGIAVVPPEITDAEFTTLADAGVVGARFNLASYRPDELRGAAAEHLLARLRDHDWHVQVHATDAQWAEAAPLLRRSGVRLLVDHFGAGDPRLGTGAPGFQAMLALAREGSAAVKLSAAYRVGDPALLDGHVALLLSAFGIDRCIWGSDWPFLNARDTPSYPATLAALDRWITEEDARDRVLRQNPARLFGFADGPP